MDIQYEPFFQAEKLTTRIKNILEEYPIGVGIFKEFIQNADDAKAKDFAILYDYNQYSTENLICDGLSEWQGPALYFYNNSVFTDKDFASISSIGQSGKINDEKTIGKYGLGFNCCYHFTDVVSFISRDQLIYFDPHACYLPNNLLGIRTNFTKLVGQHQNQLEPFNINVFGSSMTGVDEFPGTLFRIPLRSKEIAEKSLISNHYYSHEDIVEMLKDFCEISTSMLLFLKHIESVKVYIKEGDQITLIHKVQLLNQNLQSRCFFTDYISENEEKRINYEEWASTVAETNAVLKFLVETSLPNTPITNKTESWLIQSIIAHSGMDMSALGQALKYQWGGIAVPLVNHNNNNGDQNKQLFSGRVYCSLPLPIETNLPVHINGNFALSSNRRNLWSGRDMAGSGALKCKWNQFLLSNLLPRAYGSFLLHLRQYFSDNEMAPKYYDYWPVTYASSEIDSLIEVLSKETLVWLHQQRLPVIWSTVTRSWIPLNSISYAKNDFPFEVICVLKNVDLTVVCIPDKIITFMKEVIPDRYCTPEFIIDYMHKHDKKKGLNSKEADILLYYIITNRSKYMDLRSLSGLRLAPLNGSTGVFRLAGHQNSIYFCEKKSQNILMSSVASVLDCNSQCFPFLKDVPFRNVLNIQKVTPAVLPSFISQILPSKWKGSLRINIVPSRTEYYNNNNQEGFQGYSQKQLDEFVELMHKLWKFILSSDHIPRFDNFPVVLISSSRKLNNNNMTSGAEMQEVLNVITIDTLKSKGIINPEDYLPEELELLRSLGAEFLHPACASLCDRIHIPTCDIVSLIFRLKIDIPEGSSLLRQVIEKNVKKRTANNEIFSRGDFLRQLPIFKTIRNTFVVLNSQSVVLPKAWQHWHNRTDFPLNIIDNHDETTAFFLSQIGSEKDSYVELMFIKEQLVNFDYLLTMEDTFQLLSYLQYNKKSQQRLLQLFGTKEIIHFPDGHRSAVVDIIDVSSYPELASLIDTHSNINNKKKHQVDHHNHNNQNQDQNQHLFLPPVYYQFISTLRMMGLNSMETFDTFIKVLRQVVAEQSIEKAKHLFNFLIQKDPKWSSSSFQVLQSIAFLPSYDLSSCTSFTEYFACINNASWLEDHQVLSLAEKVILQEEGVIGFPSYMILNNTKHIPNQLKVKLKITTPTLSSMLLFISAYIEKNSSLLIRDTAEQKYYCNFLIAFFQSLSTKKVKSKEFQEARSALSSLDFILTDLHADGRKRHLISPMKCSVELEDDLGLFMFAIPKYLTSFANVIHKLREKSQQTSEPIIKVNDMYAPEQFYEKVVRNAMNNASFSDMTFNCGEKKFYGHGIILTHASPYIARLFAFQKKAENSSSSSIYNRDDQNDNNNNNNNNMKKKKKKIEEDLDDFSSHSFHSSKLEINVPEGISPAAFEYIFKFLYSQSLECFHHLKASEENANIVCEILHASDYFELYSVKQWCEVYLSKLNHDYHNYIELLKLAEDTNSRQLMEFAIYKIKVNYQVISHLPEFLELRDNLKELLDLKMQN